MNKSNYKQFLVLLLMAGAAGSANLHAADATVGASIFTSMGCVGCHGEGGNSRVPQMERFPMLAGLKEDYIVTQLTAFRAGKRGGLIMPAIAKALKDDEIANLAAYLATQKPPAK